MAGLAFSLCLYQKEHCGEIQEARNTGILYNRLLILLNETEEGSTFYHIALMMLQNMGSLSSLSINEVADTCCVSKSTISKFIRVLGYADYAEFRAATIFEDNKYGNPYNYINDVMGYLQHHTYKEYAHQMARDIEQTAAELDWDAIDRLVQDLITYQKVVAVGLMFSGTAAMDLQVKLGYCGKFIVTNINDNKQMESVLHADKDTLLIVFSDSGQYIDRYQSIDDFYHKDAFSVTKAKVVLITSEESMVHDPRISYSILFRHGCDVRTHRTTYHFITDMIAWRYREVTHAKK